MTGTMTITICGVNYDNTMDPLCTDVPKERGWPEPTSWRRYGRHGYRYVYADVPLDTAAAILDHMQRMADIYQDGDDLENRANSRAIREDLFKLDPIFRAADKAERG